MLTVLFANFNSFAMSVEQSRNEALFLTDKMAYELGLSNYQWDDVYEINYDFFRSLGYVTSNYNYAERLRERKLMYVLTGAQWAEYCRMTYFTVPVTVVNGNWHFSVYSRYDRGKFFDRNHNVIHTYRGNRSGWENYYSNRHVTSHNNSHNGFNNGNHNGFNNGNHNGYNNGNHNGNSNWNRNDNKGNGNRNNNNGNHNGSNTNKGNKDNRNNGNGNRGNNSNVSRTPSTGNSGSTHVTQRDNSRRH